MTPLKEVLEEAEDDHQERNGVAAMRQDCVMLADSHQNVLEGIRGLLETVFDAVVMGG